MRNINIALANARGFTPVAFLLSRERFHAGNATTCSGLFTCVHRGLARRDDRRAGARAIGDDGCDQRCGDRRPIRCASRRCHRRRGLGERQSTHRDRRQRLLYTAGAAARHVYRVVPARGLRAGFGSGRDRAAGPHRAPRRAPGQRGHEDDRAHHLARSLESRQTDGHRRRIHGERRSVERHLRRQQSRQDALSVHPSRAGRYLVGIFGAAAYSRRQRDRRAVRVRRHSDQGSHHRILYDQSFQRRYRQRRSLHRRSRRAGCGGGSRRDQHRREDRHLPELRQHHGRLGDRRSEARRSHRRVRRRDQESPLVVVHRARDDQFQQRLCIGRDLSRGADRGLQRPRPGEDHRHHRQLPLPSEQQGRFPVPHPKRSRRLQLRLPDAARTGPGSAAHRRALPRLFAR